MKAVYSALGTERSEAMDWKACAIDDLRRYKLMKTGIVNCREKIGAISEAAASGRAAIKNNGARHTDSRIIDAIVEVDRLTYNINATEKILRTIERALRAISKEEKFILEKFYISSVPANMQELKKSLGYEQRSIYRMRDNALLNFTLAMYGIESL